MEEIDKKIFNMELIVAMRKVQNENTLENRSNFINEMLRSKFISPAIVSEEEEELVRINKEKGIKTPLEISFKVISGTGGEKYLPAFTDTMQMKEWKERCNIEEPVKNMVMNFDVYARYVFAPGAELAGFVINPFSENFVFKKETMIAIINQREQQNKEKES